MKPSEFLQRNKNPKIYAYTTPHYANTPWKGNRQGQGLLKVGYTERDVRTRIAEQFPTKTPEKQPFTILLEEIALDDKGKFFTDKLIHKRLKAKGFHNINGEWFECTVDDVLVCLAEIKQGITLSEKRSLTYKMRPEQEQAVQSTRDYFLQFPLEKEGKAPKFLWNAKMRFGKTFATYQLAKAMGWTKLLVLTYKPAVQDAWESDLKTHVDFEGWQFIGKGETFESIDETKPYVWFASFQDVMGRDKKTGDIKERLEAMHLSEWDAVVVDEYHFGAWRENAKDLYEGEPSEKELLNDEENLEPERLPIEAKHYLYLSGTPFRALASGEFLEDQIFNWTYKDEQEAKENWDALQGENPYSELPQMVMMTYQMPDSLRQIALNTDTNEFDLNEFFKAEEQQSEATEDEAQQVLFPRKKKSKANKRYVFKYEAQVQQWLNWIRGQYLAEQPPNLSSNEKAPFPLQDARLLGALNHTFWFLPSVGSCYAMADLLKKPHNVFFHEYRVIPCAGTSAGIGIEALKPVQEALGNGFTGKSITLSCGKLTTGVSVKQWGGIFMLRKTSSPETYFQAVFRVQTPWTLHNQDGTDPHAKEIVKPTCYIFDFDPNRALSLIAEYNSRLNMSEGASTEKEIETFLRFLPVLCYDGSIMEKLDSTTLLNFVATGTGGSMLARKWQDAKLVNVDSATLEKLLDNPEVLAMLEKIEDFRNLGKDITKVISAEKSLNKLKKEKKGQLTESDKKEIKEGDKEKQGFKKMLREKLLKFVTKVPVFMYLTENREESLKDVICVIEPALFKRVTGLEIKDFEQLCSLGVFHSGNMNSAIFSFKRFEEGSLTYAGNSKLGDKVGLFDKTVNRDADLETVL